MNPPPASMNKASQQPAAYTSAAPRSVLDDAPRRAMLWAFLTYLGCALLLGYPALTGDFLVTQDSDQYIGGFPVREFAAQSLKAGEGIPQWNPYIMGGLPYIAAMHGDIFYPTFVLRALLPTDVAMTWSFIIHLVLAGLFTYIFARACGFGFWSSLIGGIAYMMSGPIAGYVSPGHDGKLYVSTLLPLMLFFLVRGVRDGRMWAWGGIALTTGLGVLSPHPQLLQYMLLAAGAFGLYLALGSWNGEKLARGLAMHRLARALAAVAVGFLMGAIQYAPVLKYVDWSPRAGGKGWDHAVSYSMPTEELLNTVVPEFTGILDNYWGRNGIHFHSEYAGVVVLVLAGLGLFASTRHGRGFRIFWAGTFVISLLWALGGSTPFYRIVYAIVPGTKFFRAPSTMMYVTMFAVAMFATMGVHRALGAAATIRTRYLIGWVIGLLAFTLFIAAGLPSAVAGMVGEWRASIYPPEQASQVVDFFRRKAEANQGAAILGGLRSTVFVFVAVALLWLMQRGRLTARHGAIALALAVVADLWSVERKYWRFSPPASELYASDPAIEAMKAAPQPGRVVSWDPFGTSVGRDPYFGGDAFMVHNVRMLAGYHGNELGRYQQVLGSGALGGEGIPVCYCRPQLLQHQNVQWFYTTVPDSLMPVISTQLGFTGAFQKVAGPVRNSAGSEVYLYRIPAENPFAWVATAAVKGSDEQALPTVMDTRFEPRRAAVVDTAAPIELPALTAMPEPSQVQANVTGYDDGEIGIALSQPAPEGSMLVVSENYYPGWQATVNGAAVPTVRANFNLIGVALPAGAREVQLRFTDPGYGIGRMLTFIAIAIAVAGIVAGVVLDRRMVRTA